MWIDAVVGAKVLCNVSKYVKGGQLWEQLYMLQQTRPGPMTSHNLRASSSGAERFKREGLFGTCTTRGEAVVDVRKRIWYGVLLCEIDSTHDVGGVV